MDAIELGSRAGRELFFAGTCMTLVAALAGCSGGATVASEAAAAQRIVEDFYVVRGRRIDLTLELDRAGIVLAMRGAEVELFESLVADGARQVTTYDDLLHVIDPAGELDRDELTLLAFDLLQKKGVHQAGMLFTPKGAERPFLLTREVIVRFKEGVTEEQIQGELRQLELRVVERSGFASNLLLVATRSGSRLDGIEVVKILNGSRLIDYAEPNAVHPVEHLRQQPNDPYFAMQWHLDNDGHDGGAEDADIDAPEAWALTRGSSDVVIAVFEDGFDVTHPDLAPNLWTDPVTGEHGKSFAADASLAGDPGDPDAAAHGTAVAGCVAARADNGIGVAGSCPECSLMLVRRSLNPWGDAHAIYWAATNGAHILSNSWTYGVSTSVPETVRDAIADVVVSGRGGKGCLVLFGVRNVETAVDLSEDIAKLEDVMAIGSIANTDQRVERCGYGLCLSVLGPSRYSRSSSLAVGTLNIATTDWRDVDHGYNKDGALAVTMTPGFSPCGDLTDTADYTLCFGGTSAATPIVAGVAGLVLSAAPELKAFEVRRLLQDTADRADDVTGVYSALDGTSSTLYCGNGRVNAFEAVRVVAPTEIGGRGGVDVFVRDNRLDWGNTEQPSSRLFGPGGGFISPFASVDIKVDAKPFGGAVSDAAAFEAFVDEDPQGGANRVHVRVRNRGPKSAENVKVALFVADGASSLPPLTDGFWNAFDEGEAGDGPTIVAGGVGADPGASPGDAWFLAGVVEVESLAYCGPSVAGKAGDAAAIATFEVEVPDLAGPAREIALLVLVDCAADPLSEASRAATSLSALVPNDNNATLRKVTLQPSPAPR